MFRSLNSLVYGHFSLGTYPFLQQVKPRSREDAHIKRNRAYYDQNLKNNLGRNNDSVKGLLPDFYKGFTSGRGFAQKYLENLETRALFFSKKRFWPRGPRPFGSDKKKSKRKVYKGGYIAPKALKLQNRPLTKRGFLHLQRSFYLFDSRNHFNSKGFRTKGSHNIIQGTRVFRSFLKKRRYLAREFGADSFEVRRHEFLFESAFGAQKSILDVSFFGVDDFQEFFDMISPGYYFVLGATPSGRSLPLSMDGSLTWGSRQGMARVFFLGQKVFYKVKGFFDWKFRRAKTFLMPVTKYSPFRFRLHQKYRKAKVRRGRPYFRFLFSFFVGTRPFRLRDHFGLNLTAQKYFRRMSRVKSKKRLVQSFSGLNKGWEKLCQAFESQLTSLLASQALFRTKRLARRAVHNGRIFVNGGKVLAENFRVRKYDLIFKTVGSFNESFISPRLLKVFFGNLYYNHQGLTGRSLLGRLSPFGGPQLQVYLGPIKLNFGLRKKLRQKARFGREVLGGDFSMFQLFGNILF